MVIQKAFDVLDSFYWTPAQLVSYENIEKINRGYVNNMEGAMEKGEKKEEKKLS